MTDLEGSFVTNIDSLRRITQGRRNESSKNGLTMSTQLAARLLPPRRFWFSPLEAKKASTVRRRAIDLGSWRLRMTVGRCSFPTVAATI